MVRIVVKRHSLTDPSLSWEVKVIPVSHAGTDAQKKSYARTQILSNYPQHQRTFMGSYQKRFPEKGYLEEVVIETY